MKQFIEFIKEVRKTPRGRAVLFFAFYFVVFALLFTIISFKSPSNRDNDYESGRPYSFDISSISKDNYHFEHTIIKDGTKYIYVGDRCNKKERFTFNKKEYYYDGNKYYVDDKEVIDPYLYPEFKDIENIGLLISSATFDSKTDYQSGNTKYNFLISSNTINSIINNKETDIDEKPNDITIDKNTDGIVDEIIYHLDSYCKSDKSCKKSLEINLTYDKFGEIEETVNS